MPTSIPLQIRDNDWNIIFKDKKLSTFEQLWDIEAAPFEPVNHRRGGMSGVYRIPFDDKNQQAMHIFLKKQQNHNTKSWQHPIKGVPTFYREYLMLKKLEENNIPVVQWLAFAWQDNRALLITNELAGYQSFEDIVFNDFSENEQKKLLESIADTLAKLHQAAIRHGSCYPKHLFIKQQNNHFICKFIDLEKAHLVVFKKKAMVLDMAQLIRHDEQLNTANVDYLLQTYAKKLGLNWQSLQKNIQKRMERK